MGENAVRLSRQGSQWRALPYHLWVILNPTPLFRMQALRHGGLMKSQNFSPIFLTSLALVFLLIFGGASLAFWTWGTRTTQGGMDLAATSHRGNDVRLSDLPGELRLVYFGYMNCPDVCLDAALSIGSAMKNLEADDPEARAALTNVFVTLDPADDVIEGTYNELEAYMEGRYGGAGFGLRPRDEADARRMANAFGIAFEYVEDDFFPSGYRVDHASLIFLTDRAGRILAFYPDRTPGKIIALEVREYLDRLIPVPVSRES